MKFFKRKKTISLIKKSILVRGEWKTDYYIEVDGNYVPNSISYDLETVERCFENVLENKGKIVKKSIVKTAII